MKNKKQTELQEDHIGAYQYGFKLAVDKSNTSTAWVTDEIANKNAFIWGVIDGRTERKERIMLNLLNQKNRTITHGKPKAEVIKRLNKLGILNQ